MKNVLNKLFLKSPLIAAVMWLGLFFVTPFIIILFVALSYQIEAIPPFQSFITFTSENALLIKPTLDNFKHIFTEKLYFQAFLTSVKLASWTTLLCLLLGYPISFFIANQKTKTKKLLLLLILIPFFTSLLIRIYGWVILLKKTGIINTVLLNLSIISEPLELINNQYSVLIGMLYSYLPFMILPLYSSIEKIHPSLVEAAQDLGAKNIPTFFKIIVPITKNGIISGCMLVFIPSIGEFVIPELLGGSEVITLGKLIWTEFFIVRNWPLASCLAVSFTLMLFILIMIINKLSKDKN